ncbi:ABC transporter permease [Candidatus Falkowbacteria bacterium]|jgi:putative ABC transport system permease protein|nr:ABC transporter permease [Candidatus Falkowbacteria bacterium]MBT4433431.1 ABC transporter permease [Candidatus Falkowbacteria bacterium]
MRLTDFFALSTRALTTKTSRTLLTVLGMGVGIGAVLFLVSLGYGLQEVLIKEITTDKSFVTLDVTPGDSELLKLTDKNIEQIQGVVGIKEVSPVKEFVAQATFNNLTGEIDVISIKPSFFELSGIDSSFKLGSPFNSSEIDKIVVSESMLKLFGNNEQDGIGKTVKITFLTTDEDEGVKKIENNFEIVGVVGKQMQSVAFIHSDNFKDYNLGDYSLIKVEAVNSEAIKATRQGIVDLGFAVSAISDIVDQANKVFKAITIVLAFFGIIALIVSAIGMFNTMTITLLERIQEIGVMKSLGASNGNIAKLFITESSIMGFLGSITGIILGLLGSETFNYALNFLARNMGGEPIDIFYSPLWFILFIVIFGSVIGFLTGVLPARRAGKIDPLDALRYK